MNTKYKYLDELSRKLDPVQKDVCCRKGNTVVAAGAGSGKTQVLATRFAWLLLEDDSIRAPMILTLTFTDKAASEMYERIYKTLEFFSTLHTDNFPEEKRARAERALSDFANVHIQTLDSYCGGILRQAANRYGIRPDFSTGSSDSTKNVQDMALKFVLQHRYDKCIQYYAPAAQIQSFATNFFAKIILDNTTLSTRPGYFSSFIDKQIKYMIEEWNRIIGASRIFSTVDEIYQTLSNLSDTDFEKYPQMKKLFNKCSEENVPESVVIEYESFISNKDYYIRAVKDFSSWLHIFDKLNFPNKKDCPVGNLTKPMVKEITGEFSGFHSIASFFSELEYSTELFSLLDNFLEMVNSQKRISGALTFSDVTSMALRVLVEQKDIRNAEKQAFSKIMIDEFQDNNGKNRDLLFLLSEKYDECIDIKDFDLDNEAIHYALKDCLESEKLFFVGDEKQSIYKFRGADVSVFNELKKDLTNINGPDAYKHMIYNYRSAEELLVTFNKFFGAYSYNSDDSNYEKSEKNSFMLEDSDAGYEALYNSDAVTKSVDKITHELIVPKKLDAKSVKAHVAMYIEDSKITEDIKNLKLMNKKDQIYYYIAEKIEKLHSDGVPYSHIAILDRSRTDRNVMTKWLQFLHIPYVLDLQNSIFTDGVVNDIYNFLRLCVYPSDINAYASYLCSPLCGLDEQDMECVISATKVEQDGKMIPFDDNSMESIKNALGENSVAYARYIAAKRFYDEQKILVLSRPVVESLNELWYSCGYKYETMLNTNVSSFAQQYDTLFALFVEADKNGNGISWVVDQLAVQKFGGTFSSSEDDEMNVKDIKYPVEKEDGIQIMTIHKSKGLQFDYVFLLGLDKNIGGDKSAQFYFSEDYGLTIRSYEGAGNYFFEQQRQISQNKNVAEFRRVGYVGVTRAIKEFWIIASHKVTKTKTKTEAEKSTVEVLKPVVESYYPEFCTKEEGVVFYEDDAPFDYEKIKLLPRTVLFNYGQRVNIDELRHEKINLYKECVLNSDINEYEVVTKPCVKVRRVTPSMLESFSDFCLVSDNESYGSNKGKSQVLPEVDFVIETSMDDDGKSKFDFAKLGTVLHKWFELFIDGMPLDIVQEVVKENYLKELSSKNKIAVEKFCRSAVENFEKTDFYKFIEYSKQNNLFIETEYSFKMKYMECLFTGSIDLCFETNDGKYIILDYKTDHEIVSEKYESQQFCYRKALSEILGCDMKDISTYLYFVRFNSFVNITDSTEKDFDASLIEKALEGIDNE